VSGLCEHRVEITIIAFANVGNENKAAATVAAIEFLNDQRGTYRV
jgi:hypothetical protein